VQEGKKGMMGLLRANGDSRLATEPWPKPPPCGVEPLNLLKMQRCLL